MVRFGVCPYVHSFVERKRTSWIKGHTSLWKQFLPLLYRYTSKLINCGWRNAQSNWIQHRWPLVMKETVAGTYLLILPLQFRWVRDNEVLQRHQHPKKTCGAKMRKFCLTCAYMFIHYSCKLYMDSAKKKFCLHRKKNPHESSDELLYSIVVIRFHSNTASALGFLEVRQ